MKLRTLLTEPSTWRGLIWLLTALGVSLNPEQQAALIAFGMAAAGLIGVVFLDQPKDSTTDHFNETTDHQLPMRQAESPPIENSPTIHGHNDR